MPFEIASMMVGILKINDSVVASCLNSPFTQHLIDALLESSSSAETNQGPMGQKVSKLLPK